MSRKPASSFSSDHDVVSLSLIMITTTRYASRRMSGMMMWSWTHQPEQLDLFVIHVTVWHDHVTAVSRYRDSTREPHTNTLLHHHIPLWWELNYCVTPITTYNRCSTWSTTHTVWPTYSVICNLPTLARLRGTHVHGVILQVCQHHSLGWRDVGAGTLVRAVRLVREACVAQFSLGATDGDCADRFRVVPGAHQKRVPVQQADGEAGEWCWHRLHHSKSTVRGHRQQGDLSAVAIR